MLLAGGIPEGRDLRGAAGQENPQSEKTLQSADRAKITAGQLSGGEAESGAWSVLRSGDTESDHKTTGQGFALLSAARLYQCGGLETCEDERRRRCNLRS